jgi:galactokinase
MRFARTGRVVRLGFLPLRVLDTAPFPPGHQLLLCNSGQKAKKTEGARDRFNQRVACYHIGREMLARAFPRHARRCTHLRDWTAANLGVGVHEIYRMLAHLPLSMCREQVREAIPAHVADRVLASHSDAVVDYPIRGVVLFGLSECARSEACSAPLHDGDAAAFGRLMSASHDGDRVTRWRSDGSCAPFSADCSDEALLRLAGAAEADRTDGDLARVSGAYACSTARIDRMVDAALSAPGVVGAQLAGAGLGGCMMALLRCEAQSAAMKRLVERVYEPEGVEPEVFACRAVSGSGVVDIGRV